MDYRVVEGCGAAVPNVIPVVAMTCEECLEELRKRYDG